MEFKKIQLNGFKSFAEKTDFLIEEGLTGIVGPNGCGKSNIVEAIRWCMGETSAKSMRGTGMEDVIFSGTANKTSKNIAEVALTLDNSEKDGPYQFKELDIINIKRRIVKEKGSRFFINEMENVLQICFNFKYLRDQSYTKLFQFTNTWYFFWQIYSFICPCICLC